MDDRWNDRGARLNQALCFSFGLRKQRQNPNNFFFLICPSHLPSLNNTDLDYLSSSHSGQMLQDSVIAIFKVELISYLFFPLFIKIPI